MKSPNVLERLQVRLTELLEHELEALNKAYSDSVVEARTKLITAIVRALKLARETIAEVKNLTAATCDEGKSAMEMRQELARKIEGLGGVEKP